MMRACTLRAFQRLVGATRCSLVIDMGTMMPFTLGGTSSDTRPPDRLETLIAGKDDYFRAKGVVIETLPNATFRVKLETGHEVTARASGKMRKGRMIRIIPGDQVEVDVSAYDPTMGRIVWRYR